MTDPVFPIALLLKGRACLVVGGSPELLDRTRALLSAGACPTVVSSAPSEAIRTLAREGSIALHERDFIDGDLKGNWLAVLVDNDDALAARSGGVLKAAFGDKARLNAEPGSASEDYSEFVIAGVPSFYFGIGGLDPAAFAKAMATKTAVPGNHSPEFAPVPEPSIRTGAEAMSLVLLDVLQKK